MATPTIVRNRFNLLQKFEPFLRLLKAYDVNNFTSGDWRSLFSSASDVLPVTLGTTTLIIFTFLMIWNSIENDADASELALSLPIVTSLLLAELIIVEMVCNNDIITRTIERLQEAVDRRQCCFFYCGEEDNGVNAINHHSFWQFLSIRMGRGFYVSLFSRSFKRPLLISSFSGRYNKMTWSHLELHKLNV